MLGLRRTAVWKGDVNFQGTMADKMDNAFKNAVSVGSLESVGMAL